MKSSTRCVYLLGLSFILIIGLFSLACQASTEDDTASRDTKLQSARARFTLPRLFDFDRYKTAFNKQYTSLTENAARARLFLGRAFRAFISAISYKQRKSSSYLAINQMSDWTPEEVRKTHMRAGTMAEILGDAEPARVEPVPVVSLDELQQELGEIVDHDDAHPDLRRLIAQALNGPTERRKRRDVEAEATRQLSMDDVAREPQVADKATDLGQRIESNNPNYEPPELVSYGWVTSVPSIPSAGEILNNIPGKHFLKWVVQTASEMWNVDDDDSDEESTEEGEENGEKKPDAMFNDHRDDCMFTPRDQGRCGSCYAFASIAVYEWLYCKATGKKVALSEQYIVDCGHPYGMDGCDGGFTHKIPKFVKKRGLELRSNYPYRQKADNCPYSETTPETAMGYLRVTTNSLRYVDASKWEKELKKGPLLITLFPGDSFSEYGGGVARGLDCSSQNAHAVVVVGSGREDNVDFWLIRNSYSAVYGEGGYYKLNKKATKNCVEHQQAYQLTDLRVSNKEGINLNYESEPVRRRKLKHAKNSYSWLIPRNG